VTRVQGLKQPMRAWLRKFPDDRLTALQTHAQDGKLAFYSCCCFAGAINAPHPLRSECVTATGILHLHASRLIRSGWEAEQASGSRTLVIAALQRGSASFAAVPEGALDAIGCRIVAAMCKAESKRREWARAASERERELSQPVETALESAEA
jgi:hypothetical protein